MHKAVFRHGFNGSPTDHPNTGREGGNAKGITGWDRWITTF